MSNTLEEIEEKLANIESKIDAWFQSLVHGTIVQRDPELYNKFHTAKESLKQDLTGSTKIAQISPAAVSNPRVVEIETPITVPAPENVNMEVGETVPESEIVAPAEIETASIPVT